MISRFLAWIWFVCLLKVFTLHLAFDKAVKNNASLESMFPFFSLKESSHLLWGMACCNTLRSTVRICLGVKLVYNLR